MAVTADTHLAATTAFSSGTVNVTYVVGSGANWLLFDFQNENVAGKPSSVTYNGVALTKIVSNSATGVYAERWELANPATGSHTLSYTLSASVGGSARCIHSYAGVTSSTSQSKNTDGSGPTCSDTITSATGDLATDYVAVDNAVGAGFAADAGQTVLQNASFAYLGQQALCSDRDGAAPSVTMGWTETGANMGHVVQLTTNLSGGGGGGTVGRLVDGTLGGGVLVSGLLSGF